MSPDQVAPLMTDQNHFRWGYDYRPFVNRQEIDEVWTAQYGKSRWRPGSWREENLRAARRIAEAADGQPIWLCYSGGIDSEVMIRAFMEAGVNFGVATLRMKDEANQHDLFWAERFMRRAGLGQWRLVDLDVEKFFQSGEAFEFAVATQCTAPELLGTMWLMDQIDGFPVLGSGECFLVRDNLPGYVPGVSPYGSNVKWFLNEKESVASWYKYAVWRQRDCAPGFFQYTPEQLESFLLDPVVQDLVHNRIVGKRDSLSVKHQIYEGHYGSVEPRSKFTGYEKLMGLRIDFQVFLERYIHGVNQYHLTPVEDLYRLGEVAVGRNSATQSL